MRWRLYKFLQYCKESMKEQAAQFISQRYSQSVQIRKNNRHEMFSQKRMKIRNEVEGVQEKTQDSLIIVDPRFKDTLLQVHNLTFEIGQIDELCLGLSNLDDNFRHASAFGLRKFFQGEASHSVVQRIIDNGVIEILLKFLKDRNFPQLQYEACWIITHISCGSRLQCQKIIEKDGLDPIFNLLYYDSNGPILEQTLLLLGNIAADCSQCRDTVTMKGAIECLIRIVTHSQDITIVEGGAWVLCILCRGEPVPKYELVKKAIPVLGSLIVNGIQSTYILKGCLWALTYHSEGKRSKIQNILKTENIVPKLIQICDNKSTEVVIPALRILGNISQGNENQTNYLLNNHVINLIEKLLDRTSTSIRREACWTFSNICAGTEVQVQKCIYYPNVFGKLMVLLKSDEMSVRDEVLYCFRNICYLGNPNDVYSLVERCNFLETLSDVIQLREQVGTLKIALECLFEMFSLGEKIGGMRNTVIEAMTPIPGFFERLESLQYHTDQSLFEKLKPIFTRFLYKQSDPLQL